MILLHKSFNVCAGLQDQERTGYLDKLQIPRWETRRIFLCLLGKENHLHFILYLLLSSTVEMDFLKTQS